jgi:hypothetical protein
MRNGRIGRVRQVWLLAAMAVPFLAAGCSDEPLTQPAARDQAASAVCDYAGRCGNIGEGKPFATRDACLTTWKGNIQNSWPPETCQKIVQAEYEVCLNSIKTSVCQNGLDVLVILSKCGSAQVCATM